MWVEPKSMRIVIELPTTLALTCIDYSVGTLTRECKKIARGSTSLMAFNLVYRVSSISCSRLM